MSPSLPPAMQTTAPWRTIPKTVRTRAHLVRLRFRRWSTNKEGIYRWKHEQRGNLSFFIEQNRECCPTSRCDQQKKGLERYLAVPSAPNIGISWHSAPKTHLSPRSFSPFPPHIHVCTRRDISWHSTPKTHFSPRSFSPFSPHLMSAHAGIRRTFTRFPPISRTHTLSHSYTFQREPLSRRRGENRRVPCENASHRHRIDPYNQRYFSAYSHTL